MLEQYSSLARSKIGCRLRIEPMHGSDRESCNRETRGARRRPRQADQAGAREEQEQRQRHDVVPADHVDRRDEGYGKRQDHQHPNR